MAHPQARALCGGCPGPASEREPERCTCVHKHLFQGRLRFQAKRRRASERAPSSVAVQTEAVAKRTVLSWGIVERTSILITCADDTRAGR